MSFYHVAIEKKTEQKGKSFNIYAYDFEKQFLIEKIVSPYLSGQRFVVDGYILSSTDISRIKVVMTDENINNTVSIAQRAVPSGVIMIVRKSDIIENSRYSKDVTQTIIDEFNEKSLMIKEENANDGLKYIFVVHGRNIDKVNETENFIRTIGFEPIVLFKEADAGLTIIEKIEKFSSLACFAIILYTECDIGYLFGDEKNAKPRARQNVVFEHGYLMAKLGRNKVCALLNNKDIEMPSDISGIIFKDYDESGYWRYKVAQEMVAAGIEVDFNKLK